MFSGLNVQMFMWPVKCYSLLLLTGDEAKFENDI